MADFPLPVSGTAWAAGGVSGKMKGSNMRRRRYVKQVPRTEKFWVPYPSNTITYAGVGGTPAVLDSASLVCRITGGQMSTTSSGLEMSRQRAKLWRLDGRINLFMDPERAAMGQARNWTRVRYMWMLNKLDADAYGGTAQTTPSAFEPLGDQQQLFRRDDILKWGDLDVYGTIVNDTSQFPVPLGINSITVASEHNSNAIVIANPQHALMRIGCRVPWPRLPKAGLNLYSGVSLDLLCQAFQVINGGYVGGENVQEIYADVAFRSLVSAP